MPVTSSIAAPAQPALQPHQHMWLAAIDAYARTWPAELAPGAEQMAAM